MTKYVQYRAFTQLYKISAKSKYTKLKIEPGRGYHMCPMSDIEHSPIHWVVKISDPWKTDIIIGIEI